MISCFDLLDDSRLLSLVCLRGYSDRFVAGGTEVLDQDFLQCSGSEKGRFVFGRRNGDFGSDGWASGR